MDLVEHVMDGERTVLLETINNRIKYIIQSVETLLNNDGNLQIAGALYIHAVEEHGKYLYVELLSSNNGIVEVERPHFFSVFIFKKGRPILGKQTVLDKMTLNCPILCLKCLGAISLWNFFI